MAIDFENIRSKFVSIVRDAVGTDLSFIAGTYPAVIIARPDTPKPDYPYVVVDTLSTQQENGWLYNSYANENDFLTYETNYEVLFQFRVYGGDSISIANKLEGYFRLNRVLDEFTTDTGGNIVNTNPIQSLPELLADKYVESASFTLVMNITDTFVDDSEECVIENVHLDGELAVGEDDPDPLQFTIDVSKPTP
jgi:hypothetical protein